MMKCWFCGQEKESNECDNSVQMEFEKFRYAQRLIKDKANTPKGLKETLVIGRCDACYVVHKRFNRISLFVIIPFVVMAIGFFLLFKKVDENIVFACLVAATIGFGLVVYFRMNYLAKQKIRSLVEMEMKNNEIQNYLADGWYRS